MVLFRVFKIKYLFFRLPDQIHKKALRYSRTRVSKKLLVRKIVTIGLAYTNIECNKMRKRFFLSGNIKSASQTLKEISVSYFSSKVLKM